MNLKCTKTGFFLARIFPYSDWKRENTDQKKLRIWTLFRQWLENVAFSLQDWDLFKWIDTTFNEVKNICKDNNKGNVKDVSKKITIKAPPKQCHLAPLSCLPVNIDQIYTFFKRFIVDFEHLPELYSEACLMSKVELLANLVKGRKPFIFLAKNSVLDVW